MKHSGDPSAVRLRGRVRCDPRAPGARADHRRGRGWPADRRGADRRVAHDRLSARRRARSRGPHDGRLALLTLALNAGAAAGYALGGELAAHGSVSGRLRARRERREVSGSRTGRTRGAGHASRGRASLPLTSRGCCWPRITGKPSATGQRSSRHGCRSAGAQRRLLRAWRRWLPRFSAAVRARRPLIGVTDWRGGVAGLPWAYAQQRRRYRKVTCGQRGEGPVSSLERRLSR